MNMMEFNKIFAALLVAGIIASLSGFITKELMHSEHPEEHAYKIEGVEEAGGHDAPAKPKTAEPVLAMIAGADIAQGEKLSRVCAACHSFTKGGANGTGPNLWGVVGAQKGYHAGFSYSKAIEEKGGSWDYASLNQFLWKPKAFVDGTKMNFIGLKKPEDRAAIIAWLRTLSDSPAPLPSSADIAAEKALLGVEEVVEEIIEGVEATEGVEELEEIEKILEEIPALEEAAH